MLAIKTQPLQNRFGLGRVFEPTFALKLVLQIAVALEHFLKIGIRLGHAMLKLVHLVFDLLQVTESGERRFVNGGAGFKVNVLRKQTQTRPTRTNHLTSVRRFFSVDETKDGCLAGAVASYQSHVFAGIYLQRRATQNILRAVGLVNI